MTRDLRQGISLPELLMIMAISTFIAGSALAALQSVSEKMRLTQDLHSLVSFINKARYLALESSRSHRLLFVDDLLIIEERDNGRYREKERLKFAFPTRVGANANPVFSSLGLSARQHRS